MTLSLLLSCNPKQEEEAQENNDCQWAQSWDYPVKPGMEEWKELNSNQKKVDACQIPDSVLFCLSTKRLTELCLQYPLLGDIYAFNFLDHGLDKLFMDFNGIKELYKRKEVSDFLIKQYIEKIQSLSSLDEIPFDLIISTSDLHALLSRVERQNEESIENLREILRNLIIGYEAISMLSIDTRFLMTYHFFSRAHVIIKICEQCLEEIPMGKGNSVFSPHGADAETIEIINRLSYQLIQ